MKLANISDVLEMALDRIENTELDTKNETTLKTLKNDVKRLNDAISFIEDLRKTLSNL